jgi:hypothetical protein
VLGILTTGELWATNAAYLNDSSELKIAAQVLSDAVDEFATEFPDGFSNALKELDFVALQHRGFLATLDVFVACFCVSDDLLSQWRGYASGRGYAIGIDTGKIELPDTIPAYLELRKVLYKRSDQLDFARSALRPLVERAESIPIDDVDGVEPDEVVRLNGAMAILLMECAACFKDPTFREEHEWRLISWRPRDTVFDGRPELRLPDEAFEDRHEIHVRVGANGLTPYVKLDALRDPAPALCEVVVGPTLDRDLEKRAIVDLLEKAGFGPDDVEVRCSAIPLRW